MDILKSKDIIPQPYEACHNGAGILLCKNLLSQLGSKDLHLMHCDTIPAGVSIGLHTHRTNEEIYYLVSGKGILTFDDRTYEMKAGDISLCGDGHSHAFEAVDDCTLIVVGSKHREV